MFAVVLFGLLANAAAAPYHRHHSWHRQPSPSHYEDPDLSDFTVGGTLFDTSRFWEELSKELMSFDRMLQDFHRRFPSSVELEGIDGDEYKITIPLAGYDEKDIVVKAREGVLMVQAVHKSTDSSEVDQNRSYLGIRNLPSYVRTNGTYIYEDDELKIVFPLIRKPVTHEVTEAPATTAAPDQSREEMEPHEESDNDADVGLTESRGDKDREILTNEVPTREGKAERNGQVEATTYAVDLKNEYEFVPASFR